ncbi:MAG: DUF4214 domain-containing protein [Campylobacterota bacterium]|nr:DUF4214 domain-containing protein [Campylobacterota bacterium]
MLYTISREQVAEIYVATFNRAPDLAGLVYWSDHAGFDTIEQIAGCFFEQPETLSMYPETMNNAEFVNEIYNNAFNRDASSTDLAYWVDALNSGTTCRADMIISIVNGAQGADQKVLDNKTEVGLYFAQNGSLLTLAQAYEVMENVTSEGSSVSVATAEVDYWVAIAPVPPTPIPPSSSIFLTTKIDSIEGLDINSMINGVVDTANHSNTTLNAGDIIDGGGGNDVLFVEVLPGRSTNVYIANMSNVESLVIDSEADNASFDLTGTTGIDTITIHSKEAESEFTLKSSNAGTARLIDGSGFDGQLTITGGVVNTDGSTILGGIGVDTINLIAAPSSSTNVVIGDVGADKIVASPGIDTFRYADKGDTGITVGTADVISSFETGADKISFDGMGMGNDTNFAKGPETISSFEAAKIAANASFVDVDPTTGDITLNGVVYSYQYDGGKTGYLFVDNNADGVADEAIILLGIGADGFNSGDIA